MPFNRTPTRRGRLLATRVVLPCSPMAFLEALELRKRVSADFELQPLSLALEPGEKWVVAGSTGSGKSTLLKMMAGLEQPDGGEVRFEGKRVKGPAERLIPGHEKIAYLSQHFELRHHYRVEELLDRVNALPYREALWIYDLCRITPLLHRKEHELSGGERQRVATARLLVQRPSVLLLDEPFSNLDRHHKTIMQAVIADIGAELSITCLLVTHDPLDALSWADRILVLRGGQEVQRGRPETLYRQPGSEYVAGLFGPYNLLTAAQVAAFSDSMAFRVGRHDIGVRPEGLRLAPPTDVGARGTVSALYFYGSHYEADVRVAGDPVRVRIHGDTAAPGQEVSVQVDPAQVWYV
ncbi:MAG: ABC transporter ATP-binding protein [Chitinophagaceae bacterium]|nr:MAG: ABC transporter ATP-binding protein [Chitinophagaceae bacterium]